MVVYYDVRYCTRTRWTVADLYDASRPIDQVQDQSL